MRIGPFVIHLPWEKTPEPPAETLEDIEAKIAHLALWLGENSKDLMNDPEGSKKSMEQRAAKLDDYASRSYRDALMYYHLAVTAATTKLEETANAVADVRVTTQVMQQLIELLQKYNTMKEDKKN